MGEVDSEQGYQQQLGNIIARYGTSQPDSISDYWQRPPKKFSEFRFIGYGYGSPICRMTSEGICPISDTAYCIESCVVRKERAVADTP